jgi:hypothetical protein
MWTVDRAREQLPSHWTLGAKGMLGIRKHLRTMSSTELEKDAGLADVMIGSRG